MISKISKFFFVIIICLACVGVGHSQSNTILLTEDQNLLKAKLLSQSNLDVMTNILQENQNLITVGLIHSLINEVDKIELQDRKPLLLQLARKAAIILGNKELEGLAVYKSASINPSKNMQLVKEEYIQSIRLFEEANSKTWMIKALAELGVICRFLGELRESYKYSIQSLEIANSLTKDEVTSAIELNIGNNYANFAAYFRWDGNYNKAIDYLNRSLDIFLVRRDVSNDVDYYILYALSDLGHIYRTIGEYDKALSYYNKALLMNRRNHAKAEALLCNSIGVLYYYQRDYTKALNYFYKTIKLYQVEKFNVGIGYAHLNIASVLLRQSNISDASFHLNESLNSFEQAHYKEGILLAKRGVAEVQWKLGNLAIAHNILDKCLDIANELHSKVRVAEISRIRADILYSQKKYDLALENASKAYIVADKFNSLPLYYLSATIMGKVYYRQGNIEQASIYLSQAISKIEDSRYQISGLEKETLQYFEDKVEPYQVMTDLLISQGQYFEALAQAEMAKSRVIIDLLKYNPASNRQILSDDELKQEEKLKTEAISISSRLNVLKKETGQKNEKASVEDLQKALKEAKVAHEEYRISLYEKHPELRIKRADFPKFDKSIAKSLIKNPSTAILEYVVTGEKVYAFLLTNNKDQSESSSINIMTYSILSSVSDLKKEVDSYYSEISKQGIFFKIASKELYSKLIKPFEGHLNGITELCIIPDQFLWKLPFQTLVGPNDQYLLEKLSIYYSPSLTYLYLSKNSNTTNNKHPYHALIVGDPSYEGSVNLPGAKFEAESISKLYGEDHSYLLIGTQALKSIVKEKMAQANIIHFATHAMVDDSDPFASYLDLAIEGQINNQKGALDVSEIMQMQLNADLVCLSGCETGKGKISLGEGVIGMAWGFLVAGVKTTIVSQWKVDSASSSDLMIEFHQQLLSINKDGSKELSGKSSALRNAALKLKKKKQYQHPYFWAGFIVMGSDNQ